MNRKLTVSMFGVALAAAAFSFAGNPPTQSDLAKEVASLRAEVNELKKKGGGGGGDAESLRAELKKTQAELAETIAYLGAQADSAQALSDVLNDSEKKGFTYGINPDSRIVMLQGLHAFCDGLNKNVPGKPKKEETEKGQ